MASITAELPSLNTGAITFIFSNFASIFVPTLKQTVNAGISLTVHGLSVNVNSFSGLISGPLSILSNPSTSSPAVAMQNMDFTATFPISIINNQPIVPSQPLVFTLSVKNLIIYDVTLSSLNFIFTLPTTSTSTSTLPLWQQASFSMEASLSIIVPIWSSSPIIFHSIASYVPSSSSTSPSTFSFIASVPNIYVHPFGFNWLTLSNSQLSLTVLSTAGAVTNYDVSLTTQATFSLDTTKPQPPITLTVSLIGSPLTVTLSAKNVQLAQIYPQLVTNHPTILLTTS